MNLIKERHYFFIFGIIFYFFYLYVFYYFFKKIVILCIIIGISIHAFQLIYTNKIIVKKYWDSPYRPELNYDHIEQLNFELSQSPYYL